MSAHAASYFHRGGPPLAGQGMAEYLFVIAGRFQLMCDLFNMVLYK